eukprot:m.40859 g.40859  ORF g.40859 m.40859 type:complete len:196 (-) comp10477_c0_seq1:163-750(-)
MPKTMLQAFRKKAVMLDPDTFQLTSITEVRVLRVQRHGILRLKLYAEGGGKSLIVNAHVRYQKAIHRTRVEDVLKSYRHTRTFYIKPEDTSVEYGVLSTHLYADPECTCNILKTREKPLPSPYSSQTSVSCASSTTASIGLPSAPSSRRTSIGLGLSPLSPLSASAPFACLAGKPPSRPPSPVGTHSVTAVEDIV